MKSEKQSVRLVGHPRVNDSYFEGPETFQVTLSNPSGNSAIGAPGPIVVTITDDEVANGPNPVDSTPFFVWQQ